MGVYLMGVLLLDVHFVGVYLRDASYGLIFTGHQRLTSYRRASQRHASYGCVSHVSSKYASICAFLHAVNF